MPPCGRGNEEADLVAVGATTLGSWAAAGVVTSTAQASSVDARLRAAAKRLRPKAPSTPQDHRGARTRRIAQPSSWCRSTVADTRVTTITGTHTATTGDTSPATPIWRDTSAIR